MGEMKFLKIRYKQQASRPVTSEHYRNATYRDATISSLMKHRAGVSKSSERRPSARPKDAETPSMPASIHTLRVG